MQDVQGAIPSLYHLAWQGPKQSVEAHHMLAIQPGGLLCADEELAAVRVGTCVMGRCHHLGVHCFASDWPTGCALGSASAAD